MRCMSKCVLKRSTRVYSVLLGGITFGFALSTLLQSLSYSELSKRAAWSVDYPSQLSRGGRVGFSNLAAAAGGEEASELKEEEIDIGGYYDYERLVLLEEERETRRERDGEEEREASRPQAAAAAAEQKLRKREYVSDGWQGRNVREATEEGNPAIRLSDELAPRRSLLVAVITSVSQLMSQTLAVQGTWAKEANHIIYFIGEVRSLPHLPHGMEVVQLEGLDDAQAGWEVKELSVISYVTSHYLETTDWVLIVGDETYVSPATLEAELNKYDASIPVYLGRPLEGSEGGGADGGVTDKLCNSVSGVVYSRAFLEQLQPYLPVCWPGTGGEMRGLSGCVSVMGLKCTAAKQVREELSSDVSM